MRVRLNLISRLELLIIFSSDARNMAKDIMTTLTDLFKIYGQVNDKQAMEQVATLMKSGRYVTDIW